jgi:hypothetical protein
MSASYAITLVHGTFAHSPDWTKEGSRLRKVIEREAHDTKFYCFPWSGANTNRARLEAGMALSSHLKEVRELLPEARQVIIAHSHGGNIAIYAVKRAGIQDISIVTLNTPFIQVTPREVILLIGVVLRELGVGFGAALTLGALWIFTSGIGYYQVIALFIVACILGILWILLTKWITRWVANKILPGFHDRQDMLVSNLSSACIASQRLLALNTVGDEVETFLRTVDYLGELPARSVNAICGCFEGIRAMRETVRAILSVPLDWDPFGVGENLRNILGILLMILTFGPTVVLLLVIPLYVFVMARMVAYWDWDDSVASYALVHLHTSARPEILWTANEAKAFRFGSSIWPFRKEYLVRRSLIGSFVAGKWKHSLKHSLIYEDEAAIQDIMRWSFAGEIPQGSLPFFPPDI